MTETHRWTIALALLLTASTMAGCLGYDASSEAVRPADSDDTIDRAEAWNGNADDADADPGDGTDGAEAWNANADDADGDEGDGDAG